MCISLREQAQYPDYLVDRETLMSRDWNRLDAY